jgi:hypothetical protein
MPRFLRWSAALLLLAASWLLFGLPALGLALAVRPPPPIRPAAAALRTVGDRLVLGGCWRERVGRLIHVHLAGRTEDFGYAEGLLVGDRVAAIEGDMMAVFVQRVPSFLARHLLLGFVNANDRALETWFHPEELLEIAAITGGHRELHDAYLAMSPSFARGLQYHALHDISQYLIDNPLVHPPQVGCTAVAAAGPHTVDGHLLVGRLFDFEGGRRFDLDKVVYTVAPQGGHRFLSVAWGATV